MWLYIDAEGASCPLVGALSVVITGTVEYADVEVASRLSIKMTLQNIVMQNGLHKPVAGELIILKWCCRIY
jgi:hypothetical protein